MINLQPLIETFKKAIYGRDVRQSIVDLAQAIGDNHNEQEGLRDEVKSLDSDIKVKKEEAEQAINIAISSVNSAKTEAEESINATINTLNTGKEEIENLANAKGRFLEIKFQSLKQMLIDFATTKDEEIRNTADGKIDEIATTATTESDKIKVVTTTANESKTALESTIQQSESSKTSLDSTIQRGTAKDKELENHIAEINQIIAEGKAVTKDELKEEILKLKGLSIEVLDTLPESGKAGVIYFIKATTQGEQNLFDEYAWVQDKWEMLGSKSIDLSQYVEKAEHESFKRYTVGKIGAIKGSVEKLDEQIRANTPLVSVAEPLINSQDSGKKREYYWFVQKTPINCTEAFTQHVKGYCKVVINKNQDALYSLSSESAFEIVIKGWEGTSGSETDECIEIFEQFKFASFDLTRNIAVFKPNIIGIFQDNELLHIKFTVDDIQSAKEHLILNIMVEGYI